MAPPSWATAEQLEWLRARIGKYMDSKQGGDQIEFFVKTDEAWFQAWPEEAACNLPSRHSGQPLTPEQARMLSEALVARKAQLRSWYRNNTNLSRKSGAAAVKKDDGTLAAKVWQIDKRTRDPQLVELYQVKYKTRVKAALTAAGFDKIGANDDWVAHEDALPPQTVKDAMKAQRSERMRMMRMVSTQLFEGETDEVKAEMEEELRKVKEARMKGEEPELLTPKAAQKSLDQVEAVTQRFHSVMLDRTEWVGISLFGGPMPNRGGQLSTTLICSGRTPAGNTFREAHPDWQGGVSKAFGEWLKRIFSRADRDAMALPEPEDDLDLDELIQLSDSEDTSRKKAKAKTVPNKKTSKAPKRSNKRPTKPSPKSPLPDFPSTSLGSSSAQLQSVSYGAAPQSSDDAMPSEAIYGQQAASSVDEAPWTGWNIPGGEDNGWRSEFDGRRDLMDTTGLGKGVGIRGDVGFGAEGARELDAVLDSIGHGDNRGVEDSDSYTTVDDAWFSHVDNLHVDTSHLDKSDFDLRVDVEVSAAQLPDDRSEDQPVRPRACFTTAPFAMNREIGVDARTASLSTPLADSAVPPAGSGSQWLGGFGRGALSSRSPPQERPFGGTLPSHSPPQERAAPAQPPAVPARTQARPPVAPAQRTPVATNRSPLPPRMARSSASAIATSTAALAAAMASAKEDAGAGSDESSDEEEEMPLAGPSFPESRPMANPPKPYKRAKPTTLARGGRGRGGRGGRQGGVTRGSVVGRGNTPEHASLDEEQVQADMEVGVAGTSKKLVGRPRKKVPGGGDSGMGSRTPLQFLQTYGDNNEVIPLPLDTNTQPVSAREKRRLLALSKEMDEAKKKKARKPPHPLHNPDGPTDLVVLKRLPGAPMPPVPQLGRPERARRAPKNANDDLMLMAALTKKRKADAGLEGEKAKRHRK